LQIKHISYIRIEAKHFDSTPPPKPYAIPNINEENGKEADERKSDKNKNQPAQLLEPNFLQPEYIIEIKVLKGRCWINFCLGFISRATMGRTFQVKPPVNCILRTEQIPHYDKSNLKCMKVSAPFFL
jgi:hypothetical protein